MKKQRLRPKYTLNTPKMDLFVGLTDESFLHEILYTGRSMQFD